MKGIKNFAIVFLLVTNVSFLIYAFYQHTLKVKVENDIANCHSELIIAKERAEQAREMAEQQAALAQAARERAQAQLQKGQSK